MTDSNETTSVQQQIAGAPEILSDEQIDDVNGGGIGTAIGATVGVVAGLGLTVLTAGAAAPLLAAAGATMGGLLTTGAVATVGLGASGALVGTAVDAVRS